MRVDCYRCACARVEPRHLILGDLVVLGDHAEELVAFLFAGGCVHARRTVLQARALQSAGAGRGAADATRQTDGGVVEGSRPAVRG